MLHGIGRPSLMGMLVLFATGVLASGTALAQAPVIRVRLTDQETQQPLAGVLVSALDAAGAVGPSVLSSSDGTAGVRVAGAGPHRLLIRRIGFAPVTTGPITEPSEAGPTLEVIVPVHRITLGTVRVVGALTCTNATASPAAGAAAAWNEVRTALETSALTRSQRLVTTNGITFQRDLRPDGFVERTDTTLRGRSGERPFFAQDPVLLERDGYFRQHDDGSQDFYGPDERVLLSDGFTRHHCVTGFSEIRHDSAGTEVALAFVPRTGDTRPEIRGLIWIDSATSELRRIAFEYVRVALPAPADSIGGSVDFSHLGSGAWIISAWTLRIPRWRMVDRRTNYVVLDGYTEVGGRASAVRDVALPGPNVPRTIVGAVYDSLAHRPLVGAHVRVADLGREAIADSLGAFRFDSVGAGIHTVWADHPRLDSLGLFSLGARVDATERAVTDIVLAVPAFATLWHRACPADPLPSGDSGIVFGRVVLSGITPVGASAAAINVAWRPATVVGDAGAHAAPMQRTVHADSTGNYVVCGAPVDQALALSVSRGDTVSGPVAVRLGPARIARSDLTLEPQPSVPATGGAHTLRIISVDSQPVAYANVSVNGGTTLITNEKGEVGLGAGPLRGLTLSVRRIGFAPWFGKVDMPEAQPVYTVTLGRVGQQLGAVRITGRKNPSSPFVQGFYDRWLMRQKGLLSATFIGPEEIEFRHPDQITNMLSGVSGVRFVNTCFARGCWVAMASDAPTCPMAIVIDGQEQMPELISPPQAQPVYAVRIDRYVSAADVMAIEVYARGANMPISLQTKDNRCGVIAFWTGSRR